MLSLLGDQFIVQANDLFPFFLLFRPGTVNRYCTAVLTYIVNYRLRRRDSFTAHEAAGVSILCWAELFLPLYWLDCRVKVDRDCCFGSRAGSRSHSPLECCLVRYSLNSHTGRWIALPQFFFSSVLDCSGDPPPPNIPRWEKTERSDMLPCVEAHMSHFNALFFCFFSPSTRHLDYPAFHTFLFCRSKTTSPIGLRSWKRGWVWFISSD